MWIQIIIAIVLLVVSYFLTPRPKQPAAQAPGDLDKPTADASKPVPVVFGTITIQGPNCLWYGEISQRNFKVKA